jgi:alpha-glucosidase
MYYGDEIGLEDVPIAPGEARDPWEHNEPGLQVGRDPQRAPMQWDGSPGAGFSTATPWLPLEADFSRRNVEALRDEPSSILALYRRLIALRRDPIFQTGSYHPIEAEGDLLMYGRGDGRMRFVVALNFGREALKAALPVDAGQARIILSTFLDREEDIGSSTVTLRPNEGVILALK